MSKYKIRQGNWSFGILNEAVLILEKNVGSVFKINHNKTRGGFLSLDTLLKTFSVREDLSIFLRSLCLKGSGRDECVWLTE